MMMVNDLRALSGGEAMRWPLVLAAVMAALLASRAGAAVVVTSTPTVIYNYRHLAIGVYGTFDLPQGTTLTASHPIIDVQINFPTAIVPDGQLFYWEVLDIRRFRFSRFDVFQWKEVNTGPLFDSAGDLVGDTQQFRLTWQRRATPEATITGGRYEFMAAPEPATWATMLIGLCLTGAVFRHAKRRSGTAARAICTPPSRSRWCERVRAGHSVATGSG
jgi:hypothetical protein